MEKEQLTLFTSTPSQLLCRTLKMETARKMKSKTIGNKHYIELIRSIPNFSGGSIAVFKERYSELFARLLNVKDLAKYYKMVEDIENEFKKYHG